MQPGATGVRPIGEYSASFVTRWSSHETMQPYDALRDKHASNYFDSGPVKKHLDKLRKVSGV